MHDLQKKAFRRTIENRRRQIVELLNSPEQHGPSHSHNANAISNNPKVSISSERRTELMRCVRDIDIALERIRDNTIGLCVNCGEEISTARLLASPANQYCMCCQVELNGEQDRQTPYTLWKFTA